MFHHWDVSTDDESQPITTSSFWSVNRCVIAWLKKSKAQILVKVVAHLSGQTTRCGLQCLTYDENSLAISISALHESDFVEAYVRTGATTTMKVKSCFHLVKDKHFRRQMKLKATGASQRKVCFFEITAVLTDPTVMSKLHSSGTKLQNPRLKMWLFINTLDCLYTNLPTWLKLLVNKREKLGRFNNRRNPSTMVSISWA